MDKEELKHSLENSITLNDLAMLRNIINVASKRGAFGAEEFSNIGIVYNKIDTFLKLHLKTNEEDEEEDEDEHEDEKNKEKNKDKEKKPAKEKKGKKTNKENKEKNDKSSDTENKIEI